MNYRYFIPTAMLVASLAFVSSAHADQAVGWYFGKWNCTLAKSSMAINITLGGDGVAVGRARIGQSGQVNLRLTSASASAIALSEAEMRVRSCFMHADELVRAYGETAGSRSGIGHAE